MEAKRDLIVRRLKGYRIHILTENCFIVRGGKMENNFSTFISAEHHVSGLKQLKVSIPVKQPFAYGDITLRPYSGNGEVLVKPMGHQ